MPSRLLRIAARVEFGTLTVMLLNLATVHSEAVSSVLGPTHGCAYPLVIIAALRKSRRTWTSLLAFVPGIGGLPAVRRLRLDRPPGVSMAPTGR